MTFTVSWFSGEGTRLHTEGLFSLSTTLLINRWLLVWGWTSGGFEDCPHFFHKRTQLPAGRRWRWTTKKAQRCFVAVVLVGWLVLHTRMWAMHCVITINILYKRFWICSLVPLCYVNLHIELYLFVLFSHIHWHFMNSKKFWHYFIPHTMNSK